MVNASINSMVRKKRLFFNIFMLNEFLLFIMLLNSDPNIEDSTVIPHASVIGFASNPGEAVSYDIFSFTVTNPGLGIFDIDFARSLDANDTTAPVTYDCPGVGCIDTYLTLYDSSSHRLWTSDDSDPSIGEQGSFSVFDTYFQSLLSR